MTTRRGTCTGTPDCTAAPPVTALFACGWRCPAHSPAAMAGRPEPPPGPGWPAGAWTTPSPLSTSRVHDARAVASGKRRSAPHAYRAAQAAVTPRKDPT